jgi:hypothetical protein
MPAIPLFVPTFQHTDWVDNQDRVTAGGPNGFNVRFQELAADLGQLSLLVKTISDQFDIRPPATVILDQQASIPPGAAGMQIQIGDALPVSAHVYHLVSVLPSQSFVGIDMHWEETSTIITDIHDHAFQIRNLTIKHSHTAAIPVSIKVLRIQ